MTSKRKYKQYIKLRFDFDEDLGDNIREDYGRPLQDIGIGLTSTYVGKPKVSEVKSTILKESYQLEVMNSQTAECRYYDADTKYALTPMAEKALTDFGFVLSWKDNSKEEPRPDNDRWSPHRLYLRSDIVKEFGLYYIYDWDWEDVEDDWQSDFHLRKDATTRDDTDLNLYGFSVSCNSEFTYLSITITCAASKASTFVDADDQLQKFVGWLRRSVSEVFDCRSSISCAGEVEIERDIACTKFVDEEEE